RSLSRPPVPSPCFGSLLLPGVLGKPRHDLPRFDTLIESARNRVGPFQAVSPGIVVGQLPERNDWQLVARLAVDLDGQTAARRPVDGAFELQQELEDAWAHG